MTKLYVWGKIEPSRKTGDQVFMIKVALPIEDQERNLSVVTYPYYSKFNGYDTLQISLVQMKSSPIQ